MPKVIKAYDNLELDFNNLTKFLSSHNWVSKHSGNWIHQYALQSCFVIEDVHQDPKFETILRKIANDNELSGQNIDVHLFVGFAQGASSTIHKDNYSVYLYGLYGETMYIVNEEKYILGKGDFIKINRGDTHQAIGLSPRIILSLAEIPNE